MEASRRPKNSKAIGPDGIVPIMIKTLGEYEILCLIYMLSMSMCTLMIPDICKKAKVVALLRPGKRADLSSP